MSILHLDRVRLDLRNLHIRIDAELSQQITGLFGHSGAGKTTVLEIIAGLRRPHSGRVLIGDDVVADCVRKSFVAPECRRIGYVPQDLALFPHRSVKENLLFGARMAGDEASLFGRVIGVLGIEKLLERGLQNLSGGEKQRVAIGRALMASPRFLLLDEPLANLDFELKQKMLELFKQSADEFKIPMLYVSHDANEIGRLCNEVILLENGSVIGHGPFNMLFEPNPEPGYVRKHPCSFQAGFGS